ncbi:MAG: glycosyltransferase family 2 protein [Flavobacteriales bacterium]
MKLSVVTMMYKSSSFLDRFVLEIEEAIHALNITEYEIVLVNDGCPEDSLMKAKEIYGKHEFIRIVNLSRNFGHHYAMQAGLSSANGDLIFLIDCDLETPPNVLIEMYNELDDSEFDVIYGYQESRKGNFFERISGGMFYTLLNKLSETYIPPNILTERLMKRNYVNDLLNVGDANLFMGGLMYWVGYNQKGISVKKIQRTGASNYTFRKKINLLINAVSSFSGTPLKWLFKFGLTISALSLLSAIVVAILKFTYGGDIQVGWSSLIVINVLILGVISTFLGILGIYLHKIFTQVQSRPNFIIKEILE